LTESRWWTHRTFRVTRFARSWKPCCLPCSRCVGNMPGVGRRGRERQKRRSPYRMRNRALSEVGESCPIKCSLPTHAHLGLTALLRALEQGFAQLFFPVLRPRKQGKGQDERFHGGPQRYVYCKIEQVCFSCEVEPVADKAGSYRRRPMSWRTSEERCFIGDSPYMGISRRACRLHG